MKHIHHYITVLLLLICLVSCSSNSEHKLTGPKLNPEQFFKGNLIASGFVKDRSGKIIRTFNAKIIGEVKAKDFTLTEHFIFDDGEKQERIWKFKHTDNGHYDATANDVDGIGKAQVYDNYMSLDYKLIIQYNDKPMKISIEDILVLTHENILIAESQMYKFGLHVGSITLVMQKK